MTTDPYALIKRIGEFVTTIYGPAVTFAFPNSSLISAVGGSILIWCEHNVLRELMSEGLLFAEIAEPHMTSVNFNDHFRDRMAKVHERHI